MKLNDAIQCIPQSVIEEYKLNSMYNKEQYIIQNIQKYNVDSVDIYHGSYDKSMIPTFGYGKEYNDYGKGFYTTIDAKKAKEWAHSQELDSGYLYKIELDLSDLKIFDFSDEPTFVWLAELISHRFNKIPCKNKNDLVTFVSKYGKSKTADIYFGWRADASFYTIMQMFIDCSVSYDQIDKLLRLGNQGNQIFLKTQKAFDAIQSVINLGTVDHVYYDKYIISNGNATKSLYEISETANTVANHITFERMIRDA